MHCTRPVVFFTGNKFISMTLQQFFIFFPTIVKKNKNKKTQKCVPRYRQSSKILSWSATWHVLKNVVWFEHSKCTHIDRCSRLPSPSPANRDHTHKWLLQAWRSETKTSLSAASSRTIPYFAFPSVPGLRESNDRKPKLTDGNGMKREERRGSRREFIYIYI